MSPRDLRHAAEVKTSSSLIKLPPHLYDKPAFYNKKN